jgi:tryptophan-rich sensory protein
MSNLIWAVLLVLNTYFSFIQFKRNNLALSGISAVAAILCIINLITNSSFFNIR